MTDETSSRVRFACVMSTQRSSPGAASPEATAESRYSEWVATPSGPALQVIPQVQYRSTPQLSGRGRGAAPRLSRSQAQLHHEYYAGKRSLYHASHAREAWQELSASSPYLAYPAHRSPPPRLAGSCSEVMVKKQNAHPLTAPGVSVYHDGGQVFTPGGPPPGSPRGLTATKNVSTLAHARLCCKAHLPTCLPARLPSFRPHARG